MGLDTCGHVLLTPSEKLGRPIWVTKVHDYVDVKSGRNVLRRFVSNGDGKPRE